MKVINIIRLLIIIGLLIGYSKYEKNVNNFEVLIKSLDKISHINSPDIKFTISHKEIDQLIDYNIYVNDSSIFTGKTTHLIENNVSTSLPPGDQVVYIKATDQNGNTAKSLPYYIIVGTDEEPAMYEAGVEWYEENWLIKTKRFGHWQ